MNATFQRLFNIARQAITTPGKMIQRSLLTCSLLLLLTKTLSQQSPTAAPSPPGPANIFKQLEKAINFTSFIHLIKSTHVDIQLSSQLKSSSDGITILSPTDTAFSSLVRTTLNSLKDQEKVELVQFHVLTQFLLFSQFDTVSNPVMTLAGSSSHLVLNITVTENIVNITTGLNYATITNTIYVNNKVQVAIYQIDKVLLPLNLFAPAPTPAIPAESSDGDPKDISSADSLVLHQSFVIFELGVVVIMLFL